MLEISTDRRHVLRRACHKLTRPVAYGALPRIDEAHLPKQHPAAVVDPPSVETWTQMCRGVTDEVLLHLRLTALNDLHAEGGNQRLVRLWQYR